MKADLGKKYANMIIEIVINKESYENEVHPPHLSCLRPTYWPRY